MNYAAVNPGKDSANVEALIAPPNTTSTGALGMSSTGTTEYRASIFSISQLLASGNDHINNHNKAALSKAKELRCRRFLTLKKQRKKG